MQDAFGLQCSNFLSGSVVVTGRQELALVENAAYVTCDGSIDLTANYFAPESRAAPPYVEQHWVEAVIDIATDGTLAGIELVDKMPPLPKQAKQD